MKETPLRRALGELPPIEPISTEEQAWQRLSSGLRRPEPRRTGWIWLVPAAALGVTLAVGGLTVRRTGMVVWLGPSKPPPLVSEETRKLTTAPASSLASSEPSSARVEALGAALEVSDGRRATVVHGGFELAAGMGVATSHGEARLSLPGGSLALLEPGSALGAARLDPAGVELTLASGAVFVHAAKLGAASLSVRAGDYRVVVHGTGFRVERRAGQVSVGLWHGSVEVRSDFDSRGVFLTPGHLLRFDEARGPAGAVARPLAEAEGPGAAEEARLLGEAAPAPAWHRPSRPTSALAPAASGVSRPNRATSSRPAEAEAAVSPPAFVTADVARCRGQLARATDGLRLDLTLADDGQVLAAQAEHGSGDPKLGSCIAEAALRWKLDPPPEALRGMQFVYPIGRR
ncbi:MAG: FecR domain-containing protein [Myxococcales bacterium]